MKKYCNCINPIFEHQWTQDKYLGFHCIECGGDLKPLTKRGKIGMVLFVMGLFVILPILIGLTMFLFTT